MSSTASVVDFDDSQKGQWGGQAESNGRRLHAHVKAMDDEDWFEIELEVVRSQVPPLTGVVNFHLHPTFVPSHRRIAVKNNRAVLSLTAYGSFYFGRRGGPRRDST